ncbi:MAG: DUF6496 domain-containing protein [Devosia sp.]|nr:DUF6496 domain-containing protein [Devosia sp.]
MPTQSKEQRGTVERVMHEFKQGELRTGRGNGPKVESRKQAIAIALQESGSTNTQSPQENRRSLSRTKSKERRGQTAEAEAEGKSAQRRTVEKGENRTRSSRRGDSKAALYARARQRGIAGRSTMTKAELQRALSH